MFQSTLLKRTMTLVVVSLLASAILATIAFLVAGRSATLSLELDKALAQDLEYKELFTNNPDYFNDVNFRIFFFNSTYATGHDYYLVNADGEIINSTSIEDRNVSISDSTHLIPILSS